jgi:hypothetical protein
MELVNGNPTVPTTSMSKTDGIVNWRMTGRESHIAENIESAHARDGRNPAVLWAIADQLAQAGRQWKPFERSAHGARASRSPVSGWRTCSHLIDAGPSIFAEQGLSALVKNPACGDAACAMGGCHDAHA